MRITARVFTDLFQVVFLPPVFQRSAAAAALAGSEDSAVRGEA
jgi:hypothetical protein